MSVLRERPYTNFNFLVDLGDGSTDGPQAGFEEVILPEIWLDVIEYRNGNEKENSVRKLTGLDHVGNAVLKRGVIGLKWGPLHARGKDVAVEYVVLACERLEME